MKIREPAPSKRCEVFINAYCGSGMLYIRDYLDPFKWILTIKAAIIKKKLSVDDWKYLFTIVPNNPIKKTIKEKIEKLGGTIDDLL